MDSSPMTTPPGEDNILACSRPLIERRLRPQHEQALKCPRCESTHTKFCYYNNYSLSQPRYFCKTCRRYWTKGGTLRNIPVGGGCRKNKKVSSSNSKNKPSPSSSTSDHHAPSPSSLIQHNNVHAETSQFLSYSTHHRPTDLQLAFPEQLHFSGMFNGPNPGFLLENPAPIDFMENKYEALVGSHDYLGSGDQGAYGGINHGGLMADHNAANFYDFCSPYGMSSADHGSSSSSAAAGPTILESCQRLMLPYDQNHSHHHFDQSSQDQVDVKPGTKIVSLEWHEHQQQACNSDAGYNFGGYGSWTGLMNGYGSSATNPLV